MLKQFIFIFLILFNYCLFGQLSLICHCTKNNATLKTAEANVYYNNNVIKTVKTNSKGIIKLELETGKDYVVKLYEPASIPMFFEIKTKEAIMSDVTTNIKVEIDIPFFYKYDEDINKLTFEKPFQILYFDSKGSMTSDTAYTGNFYRGMFKKPIAEIKKDSVLIVPNKIIKIAGVIKQNTVEVEGVKNLNIQLFKNNKQISNSITNRAGLFYMEKITLEKGYEIRTKGSKENKYLYLLNEELTYCLTSEFNNGEHVWRLDSTQLTKLWNDDFGYCIGGKLIQTTSNKKEFYSNKTVLLLNKNNTAIKKVKTNIFGAFVFDDIKPGNNYYISVLANECAPECRIDLLNREDKFISVLDTFFNNYHATSVFASQNPKFDNLTLSNQEIKMNVKAALYGDNINNPIGKLKVLLLNDNYDVIDSVETDNFGTFKFKYLPFLKKFFLSMENKDNELDVYKNILVYGEDKKLVKVLTHEKGKKFNYKVFGSDLQQLREIEIEDPWLELTVKDIKKENTLIVENILFEKNKSILTNDAKAILNKVVYTLKQNIKIKIEIKAHTDNIGSDASNLKLSNDRATEVKKYLTLNGVLESNIKTKGLGESQPLNSCGENCSEEEHAKNRRVEFILKKH